MRIFVGIVGVLFFLIGAVGGLVGAGVIGSTDADVSWQCTSYAQSGGSATQSCRYDSDSDPSYYARQRDLGTAAVIGGAAFFIGGCALMGGAAAGSGRKQQAAVQQYQPQPVATGGPPSYGGGGWQGGGQAGQGGQTGETARS